MKRVSLTGVYEWGLLAVLALIVLHAPLSVWLGTVFPDAEFAVKAWKELILGLLAIAACVLVARRKAWTELSRDWTLRLAATFVAIHLVLVPLMGGDVQSIVAGLMIDLRFVAMFVLAYVAARLIPGFTTRAVRVVAAGAVVAIGFGLLQITVLPDGILRSIGYSSDSITPFTTIDKNPDFVRINSTLRGPNPLGAMMVIYGALTAAYVVYRVSKQDQRRRLVGILSLAGSVAVLFASYSRSAYVAFGAAIAIVVLAAVRLSRRMVLAGVASLLVLAAGLAVVSNTDWYSNVILHEDPESTVVAKSNDEHVQSLATGAYRFATQPLGAGVGSTGSASLYDADTSNDTIIENYYFFVAHESGWLGFGVFIALFVLVMTGLWRQRRDWVAIGLFGSGVGLALIGVLLPVWADETVALTWWALVGAVLANISGIIGHNESRAR